MNYRYLGSGSCTSSRTTQPSPPSLRISARTFSPSPARRPARATRHPAPASVSAKCRPRSPNAPVTSAVFVRRSSKTLRLLRLDAGGGDDLLPLLDLACDLAAEGVGVFAAGSAPSSSSCFATSGR